MSKKVQTIPWSTVRAETMSDPDVRAAHDTMTEEFALIDALIKARAEAGLTQVQVAERMDTTQSAVARLESGQSDAKLSTLRRYAHATGKRLHIAMVA